MLRVSGAAHGRQGVGDPWPCHHVAVAMEDVLEGHLFRSLYLSDVQGVAAKRPISRSY